MSTILLGILQAKHTIGDSGPIYKETVLGRFPVEPFNTFSNLIFLFIIIYFGLQVYKAIRQHLFLAFVLPVIALSYVGGTIYHATRSAEIWLLLDWVPIMVLSLATVFYFIFHWMTSWIKRLVVTFVMFGAFFGLRMLPLPQGLTISLGYLITALTLLIPILGYLVKINWKNAKHVFIAFAVFAFAVACRVIDKRVEIDFFWMGTHWLWHLFGGIAVFFLMKFIFEDNKAQAIDIS